MLKGIHDISQQANAKARAMNARQNHWPATMEPKLITETPIPMAYTNPPVVVPKGDNPPPGPKPKKSPKADENDVRAEAGARDDADYRPDLGEYQLVIVRDKDVPNTTGYNPRQKLHFFPKGNLPGSRETFYLVTHRFADRAGINAEKRGQLTVRADSRGRPLHPLMAESGKSGREMAEGETSSEGEEKGMFSSNTIMIIAIAVIIIFVYLAFLKNNRQNY